MIRLALCSPTRLPPPQKRLRHPAKIARASVNAGAAAEFAAEFSAEFSAEFTAEFTAEFAAFSLIWAISLFNV